MSKNEFLGDRKKALENEFFVKENARLLEKLRQEKLRVAAKEELAEASGIRDEALLDHLLDLEIGPDTWTALSLVPLVEIAWADGHLDERERGAILQAAANTGVRPGRASYERLESWLERRPEPALLEAWGEYVIGIAARLDIDGKSLLRDEIVGGARRVAEAAGGMLGMGSKISAAEQAILDRLAKAFD
ncbi:MAG: hypothetical protein ACQGVC_00025 [Myxococcota bacterium]